MLRSIFMQEKSELSVDVFRRIQMLHFVKLIQTSLEKINESDQVALFLQK